MTRCDWQYRSSSLRSIPNNSIPNNNIPNNSIPTKAVRIKDVSFATRVELRPWEFGAGRGLLTKGI